MGRRVVAVRFMVMSLTSILWYCKSLIDLKLQVVVQENGINNLENKVGCTSSVESREWILKWFLLLDFTHIVHMISHRVVAVRF